MNHGEILLPICMAREIRDGDLVPMGLGTPLVAVAAMVAKLTHAPKALFLYPGNVITDEPMLPVRLAGIETWAQHVAIKTSSVDDMLFRVMYKASVIQFLRPAQVDGAGYLNTVVIGPYSNPTVRLPGPAVIPEASTGWFSRMHVYVPRHDVRAIVASVDFRAGRVSSRSGVKLFTDLCVFEWTLDGLVLTSLHPGITVDDVRQRTGAKFLVGDKCENTLEPTNYERNALESCDPRAVRRYEFLTSPAERLKLVMADVSGR